MFFLSPLLELLGGKAPSPPDYTGAAEAQAAGSRENIQEQTFANRPNIYTPYGNIEWERPNYPGAPGYTQGTQDFNSYNGFGFPGRVGGGEGSSGMGGGGLGGVDWLNGDSGAGSNYYDPRDWAMRMTLPPEMQAALESQQRIAAGRSRMGEQLLGSAGEDLSQGFDWDALPGFASGPEARQRAEDAIYQRTASRLDPVWQQRESSLETRLANQGLTPGSEAYDRALGNMGRERTDAYQTAMREAIMGGGSEASRQQALDLQARQQGISEGLQQQYGGINALNAFLAGQQVQQPQMPGFNTAGAAQAPAYLQAAGMGYDSALNQFGANQAQLQQFLQGLSSLGMML